MRTHNVNGKKTISLSPLETVRLRSISVASLKLQSLEKQGAAEAKIEDAKLFLEATTKHFDTLIEEQNTRKDSKKVR